MKKRNTTLVSIILIAIFLLGVGYATVTSVKLYINGNASASRTESDFSVVFVKNVPKVNGGVTSAIVKGNTTAELTAFLTEKNVNGENYATFRIKNISSELSAKIEVKFTDLDDIEKEYFNLYNEIKKTTLAPDEETEIKIYVDLKKIPNTRIDSTFNVNINATPIGD